MMERILDKIPYRMGRKTKYYQNKIIWLFICYIDQIKI
jgi:hypothetical protein